MVDEVGLHHTHIHTQWRGKKEEKKKKLLQHMNLPYTYTNE